MGDAANGNSGASTGWDEIEDRPVSDYDIAVQAWLSGRGASDDAAPMPESFRMMRSSKKSPEHLAALDRVKEWTRARFRLPEDGAILVSQVSCALPGCPPLETVVAFWTEGDKRHHFKVFKPVAAVVEDDLPPAFMKNALVASDDIDCECC
jgi:hypothetical protein